MFTSITDAILRFSSDGIANREPLFDWNDVTVNELILGTISMVTATISVGYAVWLIRGGSLVASIATSLPAWCSFDPLPIVETFEAARKNRKQTLDDESLTSLVAASSASRAAEVI